MFTRLSLTFIALLTCSFSASAIEQPSQNQLVSILLEAEDHLSVKPSKSLVLLSGEVDLSLLSEAQFFRWHVALIRASLSFNELSTMESSIKHLISRKSSTEFKRRLIPILSSIGIWLRKSGYLQQAKLTLTCALTHNTNEINEIKLLTSLAIASRHLNQNEYAREVYNFAKKIAQNEKLEPSIATIENNLGGLALESNDVVKAEHHFRTALALYQKESIRSGNIISGINLLQTFLIQHQHLNYQRLYPSIARLTDTFPNKSRKSTLFWLNTIFEIRQGKQLSDELKAQLIWNFNQINDRKLQLILIKYFSDDLNMELNVPNNVSLKSSAPSWFKEITQCDWQKLAPQYVG